MSFDNAQIEPRKVFLTFLIQKLAYAYDAIFDYKNKRRGCSLLLGIVNSLDDVSKDALKDSKVKLERLYDFCGEIKDSDPRKLYDTVDSYLHKTYLQEVHLGLVPASALPATRPTPSTDAKPATLTAKI